MISSFCSASNGCVDVAVISSFCSGDGNCVGVAVTGHIFEVSDTKQPDGPKLRFTAGEWRAFIAGVKAGEFDLLDERQP